MTTNCTFCGTQPVLRDAAMLDVLVVANGPHEGHHVAKLGEGDLECCCGSELETPFGRNQKEELEEAEEEAREAKEQLEEADKELSAAKAALAKLDGDKLKLQKELDAAGEELEERYQLHKLELFQLAVFLACGGKKTAELAALRPMRILKMDEADIQKHFAKDGVAPLRSIRSIAVLVGDLYDQAVALKLDPDNLAPLAIMNELGKETP